MATEAQVQMRNVTRTYQMGEVQVHALCGLDLAVQEGEFVVIVGPSGSGKTTTLNLIGGLDTPSSGELIVAGTNIASYDEKALTAYRRDEIGFIFQFFNLLPTLTASENIEFALELVERNGHKVHQRAVALLEKVGLAERADHFPSQLSGGEQQRVAIARALAKDPLILLADELQGTFERTPRLAWLWSFRPVAHFNYGTLIYSLSLTDFDQRLRCPTSRREISTFAWARKCCV